MKRLHCGPHVFTGSYRKKVKTSIASTKNAREKFSSLQELRAVLFPDECMMEKYPTRPSDARVPEENHNVQVDCWILRRPKKEADRDFHLKLENPPDQRIRVGLTAEISGLPRRGKDRAALERVRRNFIHLVMEPACGKEFKPLSVRVVGSLFFDKRHNHKRKHTRGPGRTTAWEIHPVTDFRVLLSPSW